jgi:hypothetical protein
VNPGSEPERDDTGLPPVDIEIPDDARDLDRDVQAYYRELRANRRRKRGNRWHRLLGRDGILLPLLACCLILALITGTLLTVFTATGGQNLTTAGPGARTARPPAASRTPPAQARPRMSSAPGSPSPVTEPAASLPDAILQVRGGGPVHANTLANAMLILVPPNCTCSALHWLAVVAREASSAAYLIFTPQTRAQVAQLDGQLRRQGVALALAEDLRNSLGNPQSFPQGIDAGQLTAILLSPSLRVTYASDFSPTEDPTVLVDAMTTG